MANRFCYYINPEVRSEDGQLIPVAVFENESGHRPMAGQGECAQPWKWGKDIATAEMLAAQMNHEMGLEAKDVNRILMSSMFPRG